MSPVPTPLIDPQTPKIRRLLASDPSTWKSANVPVSVVQALHVEAADRVPGESLPALRRCAAPRIDEPCPGTGDHALSCVSLDTADAVHAVSSHYSYANWSICQFVDHCHVEYVTDLVWEIDAHAGPRVWISDADWYTPSIATAVHVGRRIYDYLVGTLGVDPGYVTTSVTRMGARVTVDWRAVGPRSTAAVLAIVRYVEGQVFADGELDALGSRLKRAMGIQTRRLLRDYGNTLRMADLSEESGDSMVETSASVEIDGGIYSVRDTTADRSKAARFKGPLVRPPGALHHRTGWGSTWCRITPVPHDMFTPGQARWLAWVSRSDRGPEVSTFPKPALFEVPWPETRRAESNRRVEALAPAAALCALMDDWRSLEMPPERRAEVLRQSRRRRPIAFAHGEAGEITAEVIDAIVDGLRPAAVKRRPGKITMVCPYCRSGDASAVVYRDSGAFHCPRSSCDSGATHIVQVARDHGLTRLVPWTRASSQPVQRKRASELASTAPGWEDIASVQTVVSATVDEARTWLSNTMDRTLARDDWTVLVVQGPTGVGKTTTALDALRRRGVTIRAAFPRDDNRMALVDAYEPEMPVKVIDGRRPSNCTEYDRLATIQSRGLPARLVCNSRCPSRSGCPYLAQFGGLAGVSLAVSHAHLPLLDMTMLQNGSDVVLIDENPLNAAVETIEIDQRELDRFRLGYEIVYDDPDAEDVTFDDVSLARACVTQGIERLIAWLEVALTAEQMSWLPTKQPDLRKVVHDVVGDLALARHWFDDGELAEILACIDDDALELHDATVLAAAERYLRDDGSPPPPRAVLRALVAGLRELLHMHADGIHRPSSLCVERGDQAWTIRLTQPRNLLQGRTIILSSTLTATQFQLAFGEVPGVEVIVPEVSQRERRIVVADHQLGTERLLGAKPKGRLFREQLFATADRLIQQERERTGMPVALLGRAAVMNSYIEHVTGKSLPRRLTMPFSSERADRMAELRALTEPLGLLVGYAGGVSGSNMFQMEGRFVRSLVVLGGIQPPLDAIEAQWRGAFAAFPFAELEPEFGFRLPVDRVVDWTTVPRTVAFDGTEADGHVTAACNAFGFADPLANEVLRHHYEDELVQMVGRMRGCIPDPEGVEARAYVLAHVAPAGWSVDEVITLDELRVSVGLTPIATGKRPGRPTGVRVTGSEAVGRRVRKQGRPWTIRWLTKAALAASAAGALDMRMPTWRAAVTWVSERLVEAGQPALSEEEWAEARELVEAGTSKC